MVARGPQVYPLNLPNNWYQSQWVDQVPAQTSIQVPQVARMASGTACPVGGAGWPEWLVGRASTADGHGYT